MMFLLKDLLTLNFSKVFYMSMGQNFMYHMNVSTGPHLGTIQVFGSGVMKDGVVIIDGVVMMDGFVMSDGFVMENGVVFKDGVVMIYGVIMTNAVMMKDAAEWGDEGVNLVPDEYCTFGHQGFCLCHCQCQTFLIWNQFCCIVHFGRLWKAKC